LAEDHFPVEWEPEGPGLGSLLLSLLLESQLGFRRPEQEPKLGILGCPVQEGLDLHPRAGPVVEVHQGGDEVRSHLEASLVLCQERSIDLDLVLRSGAGSVGRGETQPGIDVVGSICENFPEDPLPILDEAET